MAISENWFLMALIAPAAWAIGALIDSCLIGANVYKRSSDGSIVSGIFCLIPIGLILLTSHETALERYSATNSSASLHFSVIAGAAYYVHIRWFFKALFRLNDVSGAETCISLSVLIVPLFAHLLMGEQLDSGYYLAIGTAGFGLLLYCWSALRRAGPSVVVYLLLSVVTISLSMVLQAKAFKSTSFEQASLVFCATCFTLACVQLVANPRQRRRIFQLFRHYSSIFLVAEFLGILALLTSHRATQQGPSVSLVTLIECLLPLIIIGLSLILVGVDRCCKIMPQEIRHTLSIQFSLAGTKVFALCMLMVSMVIVPT